jgi:hypothetical protein
MIPYQWMERGPSRRAIGSITRRMIPRGAGGGR